MTSAEAESNNGSGESAWGLLRLVAGQVCLHASMAGMRMAAPLWALQQGYGALAVGFLLALFSLTQVFLALPAGRYADRHGLRRPVALGIVAAMSGAGLAALFPHFSVLCVTALCMGGATGGASIALQRHVGRAARNATDLRRVFSWLSIGPAVSNFLGPVCVGLLIDHAGVWMGGQAADHNGFVAAFALTALVPALAWLCVRHTPELPPVQVADGAHPSVWPLLREPLMRRLLLVNWLLSSCWDVHTFVVPVIGHERGFSASVIGTILGAFAVAAASVRVLLPLVAAHLREWAVVTGAMVVTALLFGAYPFMPTAWAMGLCSVLLGLALGTVQPMIMSTLHQITPHALHGQAIALRLMSLNLSSVLMPMLFGTAGVVVGVSVVFWTVGTLVGLGAHAAWKLRP
ncbi:MFS transporter [Rhodoferax saidenbachensis]|uniref:MFS family permease n=1 Tax=Rhodoferax saidenbachensis TaxID=1484693 RepID=A0ABU1ZHJ2_9BURK|nr:MFS transporter [Rhodoferax saidenbachensis]MDR7304993.1 MFS family permease [Rhodoferax saidenbachensis]